MKGVTLAVSPGSITLRQPRAGEYGWIVQRHGALYAKEYGWDAEFEGLVARIVADFLRDHDPRRERAWIAEVAGRPAGSVMCTRGDGGQAQLRLLLVEPEARGLGVGSALIGECLRFAGQAGYREIMLWTFDMLREAARLYERAGFTLASAEPADRFGHHMINQTYRRPV